MVFVAPTLNNTLGAVLLGAFVDTILYGIACSQCYGFFHSPSSRHDSRKLKLTVVVLWLLGTAHTALIIEPLYWWAVVNFGDFSKITDVAWCIRAGVIVVAFSDLIVRGWFVYRIWILSERKYLVTIPLLVLVFALFGVTLTLGIWSFFLNSLKGLHTISYLYYITWSMVVAADFSIALSLSYLLYRLKNGFKRDTDSILSALIMYTMNTGLATSIVSAACLVAYALMPDNYIFLAVFFPLSGLYVNSLLASFNARQWLKREVEVFQPQSTIPSWIITRDSRSPFDFSCAGNDATGTHPVTFHSARCHFSVHSARMSKNTAQAAF